MKVIAFCGLVVASASVVGAPCGAQERPPTEMFHLIESAPVKVAHYVYQLQAEETNRAPIAEGLEIPADSALRENVSPPDTSWLSASAGLGCAGNRHPCCAATCGPAAHRLLDMIFGRGGSLRAHRPRPHCAAPRRCNYVCGCVTAYPPAGGCDRAASLEAEAPAGSHAAVPSPSVVEYAEAPNVSESDIYLSPPRAPAWSGD